MRKLLWRLPSRLQPKPESVVWAVAFDPDTGDAVAGLKTQHPGFGQVTGMVEANDKLWLAIGVQGRCESPTFDLAVDRAPTSVSHI